MAQLTQTPTLEDKLSPAWFDEISSEFEKDYMIELKNFLAKDIKQHVVYPKSENTFNAFKLCPLDELKVVILGQDPYHGPNQAHGLCFSVQDGVRLPPSLQNIIKEIAADFGIERSKNGDLSKWARQGVFLLNTCLSVRAGLPNSHAGKGWEIFTDKVIQTINEKCDQVVFMLWGSPARKKSSMIDSNRHLILEAPHPSPLSAHRGFLGCKHFSQANEYLISKGIEPIDWQL